MEVNIFILCYNEAILLPHTINHYKKYLPNCKITIYDNESTDNSVEIAKNLGCAVISWNSNNKFNEYEQTRIKENCYKHIKEGWIIVCDMDEWLCILEEDLIKEKENGTTIISCLGLNMIGEGKKHDLTDINLHNITKCYYNPWMNKKLCFLSDKIQEMYFDLGGHQLWKSKGQIKYSTKHYIIKHMDHSGLDFFINRRILRYNRSKFMREKYGIPIHWNTADKKKITSNFNCEISNCWDLNNLLKNEWAKLHQIKYLHL